MVSPVRPSRESITLSSRCAQNGHFTRPLSYPFIGLLFLFCAPPVPSIFQSKTPRAPARVPPQDYTPRRLSAIRPPPPRWLAQFRCQKLINRNCSQLRASPC